MPFNPNPTSKCTDFPISAGAPQGCVWSPDSYIIKWTPVSQSASKNVLTLLVEGRFCKKTHNLSLEQMLMMTSSFCSSSLLSGSIISILISARLQLQVTLQKLSQSRWFWPHCRDAQKHLGVHHVHPSLLSVGGGHICFPVLPQDQILLTNGPEHSLHADLRTLTADVSGSQRHASILSPFTPFLDFPPLILKTFTFNNKPTQKHEEWISMDRWGDGEKECLYCRF